MLSPPLTGGISASSSASLSDVSPDAYSRLTAITTGMRAISSARPCWRPTASSASCTVAPSGSSTSTASLPGALAQHREQAHLTNMRGMLVGRGLGEA